MPKYHIIINPNAGSADQVAGIVEKAFQAASASYRIVKRRGDPYTFSLSAARDPECEVIVACGGDGTVRAVARAVIECSKTLGVIPGGTLNHFATDLGIAADPAAAVAQLLRGQPISVDYADASGRIYLNNASLGIYPRLVQGREARERHIGQWPALALELARMLMRPPHRYRLHIQFDESKQSVKTPFVFIGNNDYDTSHGAVGARASLTHGRLTLLVYRRRHWIRLGLHLMQVFRGQPAPDHMIIEHPTRVTISGRTKQVPLALDGEVEDVTLPLAITLHPMGLRVIK